ncbi:aminopeptidase N [Shewanella amazonensis]|uniref:Aminopeptidase N n=1 Tax=Shewanella amazonensis (strain ATCC BAA-1098 / SB2B) TaxID=326297 RepID=A1S9R3_SHEAM|nr:aminopeptidase N [Shewanella amazonensis]ABM01120.1 aminopeptidase N. Metallo peptidase. MEROPS family M01 [Shewanella amazonensis SB2B]
MKFLSQAWVAVAAITLVSCASTDKSHPLERDNTPYISAEQAANRSQRVSNVHYELDFNLNGSAEFSATSKVRFQLGDTLSPLTLDLNKARITELLINGAKVYPNYNGSYLTLNPRLLVSGENQVQVSFVRPHSTNGEGLHRFEDPVDGRVYLYSHFEPAAAQQMFAVFDQPDLKASYKVRVTAPADWHVVTTTRESSINAQGDMRVWDFPETPLLSPYNFSLHAGPYQVWQSSEARYPMRLFARQSIADKVTPQDWFRYTALGLDYFEQYFGIPYPFKKYDQLLVPDFLYGAMENAAAITFSESSFVSSGEMSLAQKQSLAGVIMHEMAHQWFGDLVTMKWWNGLWLNESFASLMGTMALAKIPEFSHAWQSFYAGGKQRAYTLDSLVTTHPIEVPVPTSGNAFDNIDAITYQKGAASLRQLSILLGEEAFRRGVSAYLKQYSYRNATLDDFIGSLAQAAGRDLTQWTRDWLYQPGVNSIEAEFSCEGEQISHFALRQSAPADYPVLREQKVQVALFDADRHGLHRDRVVEVTFKGARTEVPALVGRQCPKLVYPNYQDWGYVKVNLDARSFDTARSQLSRTEDPLLRAMLWQSLWDSVTDGKLPLQDFLATALINAPLEKDLQMSTQIIGKLQSSAFYLQSANKGKGSFADKGLRALSQMSLRRAMESRGDKELQGRWFDAYISLAYGGEAIDHLNDLLDGASKVQGLEIDQDRRWDIIARLNRLDALGAERRVREELLHDNSDSGQKSAIRARVQRPDGSIKRQWLSKIAAGSEPFPKLRVAMANLYQPEQRLLANASSDERLAMLPELDAKGPVFARSAATLIPGDCSQQGVDALSRYIDSKPALSSGMHRALLEARQLQQRCVTVLSALPN